jgi:hypothetical protein
MHMSPWQFRSLLLGYVALFVLNDLLGRFIPRPDATPKRWIPDALHSKSIQFILAFLVILILVAAVGLTGFIGMFVFWPPAPKLFVAATITKTVVWPFFVRTALPRSEWENACGYLEAVFDGIIAAVTLFGPAKHLFFGT